MKDILRIQVDHPTGVGEARRFVVPVCRALDFSETDISNVSLIVTELATNLSKHTKGGELFIRTLDCRGIHGIEVLSIDKGPGMEDVARCMSDGFSTAGSPGTGLGAIRRISHEFDIHSEKGNGTVVMSRYWSRVNLDTDGLPERPLQVGAICLPVNQENACGDAWAVEQTSRKSILVVVDGIGHGPHAAEASQLAIGIFRNNTRHSPAHIIEQLHARMGATRGAAVAVAEVDHVNRIVRYSGVGNVAGKIVTDNVTRNMVSHNGTVGHQAHRIQEFTYPWSDHSILIMNSDGVATGVNLPDSPILSGKHPSLIAAVLFRDFGRGSDDAVVVVAKRRRKT